MPQLRKHRSDKQLEFIKELAIKNPMLATASYIRYLEDQVAKLIDELKKKSEKNV